MGETKGWVFQIEWSMGLLWWMECLWSWCSNSSL